LKQLAGPQNRITAIGDPNQAIYGFRGSDVRFFETFTEDFSPSEVFHLSDNYRSAKNLLSASGQVMSAGGNASIFELTANIYAQGRLIIHAVPTEKAEAEYVVHQIEKLVGGTSMFSQDTGRVETEEEGERTFGDIAILYRLNSQRYALQKALDRSGIPYNVTVKKTDSSLEEDWQGQYSKADEGAVVDSEKVSLMTLHASKGLEFPVVFIVGCENRLLPLNVGGMMSDIEEERRLFYVGMTRAKERLYIIRAKQRILYGQKAQHDPSPFLADIEEGLKEYEKIVSMSKSRKKSDLQFDLFQ
ncbi:MAG: ATP-dependent helicase, partial [Candidatus Omnitrophica bacterium]|nr:ATP-dependent helicase [Candidatus Omnitrophota bacterium]